ncbi:MAG: hypothetical protein RL685_5721 [Pseudomonadota bacterium]|jgi:hypothetical protein
MKTSKTALLLVLCSLGLAALGCREPRSANDAEGTLEFVVRPIAEVGSGVPQGSFEIRGIDNDERARVGIGSSAARTLSLRLPAGAYSVAWRPSAGEPAAQRDTLDGTQIVVVAPETSATVDVFGAAQRTRSALASAHVTTL